MAAAAADYFKQVARRWVGQIGAGGVADDSGTTIPLSSTTNLPTGTGVVVVIDRVDQNGAATASAEETVTGVVSGSNLVNCVRGVEGTAQAHSAGAVVEVLVTASYLNDVSTGILIQHAQTGRHTNITACNIVASGSISNTSAVGVNIPAHYGAITTDTPVTNAVTVNMAVSNKHQITLASGVETSVTLSNAQVGQAFALRLIQPSEGSSGVVTYPGSTIKWDSNEAPTLSTTNNYQDWIGFMTTAAATYTGVSMITAS